MISLDRVVVMSKTQYDTRKKWRYPKTMMSQGALVFQNDRSQVRASTWLSQIWTTTQKIELARAKKIRLGSPAIVIFGSAGSILQKTTPATANMNMISIFNPIRSRWAASPGAPTWAPAR